MQVVSPAYDGLLKESGGYGELFFVHAQLFKKLFFKAFRIFSVKLLHKAHSLFPSDLSVPDFLRGVIRGSSYTELDIMRVVVEIIHLVINAVVLTVGTCRPSRSCLESPLLYRIVIGPLRMPWHVISQEMHRDAFVFQLLRILR